MITADKRFTFYSLETLLEEVLQTLDYKIEKTKAIITSDHLPEAKIVPSQFRQLFQNLIINSLKFVAPDVQPVIKINHEFLSETQGIVFNLKNSNRYLKITCEDNGIGFEEIYAEKIFAIFQRLHGRSEYEGTGIGLAICKKIVENHEGIIIAEPLNEQGSIFTVIIPV
jgi:light-regulated signal transduction histidine kinase (bacteriophytochrome)